MRRVGWHVGRIGIASRGVIYLLLAYLAFDIARHGSAPAQTSSTGALQELEARTGGQVAPRRSGDRARLLRSVAVLRCRHGCARSHEARFVARCRDHLWCPLRPGGRACCRSFGEWRCLEQSRALGSEDHGLVRWDRGDRGGRRGPCGSGRGYWRHGASSTVTTRTWPWSACRVRGKGRSGFWAALGIWPEGPSSSCSASISWQQG